MTKSNIIELLEDYPATVVRDVTRHLRDEYDYDLRVSYPKDDLLDQLEEKVAKSDLEDSIEETIQGFFDYDGDDGTETDGGDESDDGSDEEDEDEE